jgi:chromate transporter
VIIYLISLFFDAFLSLRIVAYAFKGIQIGVIYLILSAGLKMLKGMKKTAFNISIVAATAVVMTAFAVFSVKFSAIFYILISGVLGIFFFTIKNLRLRDKEEGK